MNVDSMDIGQLRSLLVAIRMEALRRVRVAKKIAAFRFDMPDAPVAPVAKEKKHGNAGKHPHAIRYPRELFVQCAKRKMTIGEAARFIGCHNAMCYQMEKKLGIRFARAGR